MRSFIQRQVREARAYAAQGGQALHLHRIIGDRRRAPRCFVRAVDNGNPIAHLFDQDLERLRSTARRLGVRVILIEDQGTEWQHIDLCGAPLNRALSECGEVIESKRSQTDDHTETN